eukprot:s583_g15.t1
MGQCGGCDTAHGCESSLAPTWESCDSQLMSFEERMASAGVGHHMHFPMYVLKVADFLEMSGAPLAHDALQAMGLLHRWKPGMYVAFVSHQWLGKSHCDALGHHSCTLREMLRELLQNKLRIESDGDRDYGTKIREALADGYLFFDWFSIPQIDSSSPRVKMTESSMAILSLPAYVQNSDLFMALVPEVQHQDSGSYCNFTSFLQRGWCLAELWCQLLSGKKDNRVILIHGSRDVKHVYLTDWHSNTVLDGQFTVESDRLTVSKLAEEVVKEKIHRLSLGPELCSFRWFVANKPRLLDHPREARDLTNFLQSFAFPNLAAAVNADGLLCATLSGDTAMIGELAKSRADVTMRVSSLTEFGFAKNQTLLMIAAKSCQPAEVLTTLLDLRCDVTLRDIQGNNAMASARCPEQVQVLFDARADLHSGGQLTPLQLCAAHASLSTLRKLLEMRCDPIGEGELQLPILQSRGNPFALHNFRSLLHHAAHAARSDDSLDGLDVLWPVVNGHTRLSEEETESCHEALQKIISDGWNHCSTMIQSKAMILEGTPLHAAAYIGDRGLIELLRQYGAKSSANLMGMFPEDLAVKRGFLQLLPVFSAKSLSFRQLNLKKKSANLPHGAYALVMSAVADVTGEEVLSLVVNRVLNALPPRLVPSRSFLTASLQIVEALINAWFDVHQSLANPATEVQRWGPMVGDACARAWWQDAAEQQACEASAPEVLVAVLSRGQSPDEDARRGAAFICCALEDAVGSAGATALAKAQLGPVGRPNTGRGDKVSRGEFRPPSRAGVKASGDRYKLLGIKHFPQLLKYEEHAVGRLAVDQHEAQRAHGDAKVAKHSRGPEVEDGQFGPFANDATLHAIHRFKGQARTIPTGVG